MAKMTAEQRMILTSTMQKAIARGDKNYVIKMLEKEITIGGGLFKKEDSEKLLRRNLWFLLIHLLTNWGMYAQALAWTCLECDLHPENTSAFALKEQLKRKIGLIDNTTSNAGIMDDWNGIAGMREIKAIFEKEIILPLKEPEIYKRFKISLPNGILLYGPPGCGKTFFIKKLAEKIGYTFFDIKPSDIGSTYVHGGQLEIKKLFNTARKKAPAIIFLDEFEAIAPARNNSGVDYHYQAEVSELLTQLNDCQASKILVLAATNYPGNIDASVIRIGRFDKKIFIGTPDLEARIEAFKMYMAKLPQSNIRWMTLAEETPYYTFAEIKLIVNEASLRAIEKESEITTGLLYEAILKVKPALNEKLILKYFNNIY